MRKVVLLLVVISASILVGKFSLLSENIQPVQAAQKKDSKMPQISNRIASPIGSIMPFAGNETEIVSIWLEKQGWKFCNGELLKQDDYPELFLIVGHSHGGKNDTFNLPDYRGRFLRGVDTQDLKRDPDANKRIAMNSGGNKGRQVGSTQDWATALPSGNRRKITLKDGGKHNHSFAKDGSHNHDDDGYNRLLKYTKNGGGTVHTVDADHAGEEPDLTNSKKIKSVGGHNHKFEEHKGHSHGLEGGANETRPENAYVNWIIKIHQ